MFGLKWWSLLFYVLSFIAVVQLCRFIYLYLLRRVRRGATQQAEEEDNETPVETYDFPGLGVSAPIEVHAQAPHLHNVPSSFLKGHTPGTGRSKAGRVF
jgi:hypothetical protein